MNIYYPGLRAFSALCLFLLTPVIGHTYTFVPTDIEWETWPPHCKAVFVDWVPHGRTSKFSTDVTSSDRAAYSAWKSQGVEGLHHYCAGSVYLQRAIFERDERRRSLLLRTARNETEYTLVRSNRSSSLTVNVAVQMAHILYEEKKFEEALDLMLSTINLQPNSPNVYSATAIIQRKIGQLENAKKTLLDGYRVTNGNSSELAYNLGLISLELGEMDEAEFYAKKAYQLGHPLPGLKLKLQKHGRMQ